MALAVLLLGATGPLARLCEAVLPGRNTGESQITPRHLDTAALPTPTLALANAAREVLRIGDRIEQMLDNMLRVLRTTMPSWRRPPAALTTRWTISIPRSSSI